MVGGHEFVNTLVPAKFSTCYATHFLRSARPIRALTTAAAFITKMLSATCSHTFGNRRVLIAFPLVGRLPQQ